MNKKIINYCGQLIMMISQRKKYRKWINTNKKKLFLLPTMMIKDRRGRVGLNNTTVYSLPLYHLSPKTT